jgi:hypothetical protein
MESDYSKKRKRNKNLNNFTPTTYHNCDDVTNQVSNRELWSDEITILFKSIDQNESMKSESYE